MRAKVCDGGQKEIVMVRGWVTFLIGSRRAGYAIPLWRGRTGYAFPLPEKHRVGYAIPLCGLEGLVTMKNVPESCFSCKEYRAGYAIPLCGLDEPGSPWRCGLEGRSFCAELGLEGTVSVRVRPWRPVCCRVAAQRVSCAQRAVFC